MSNQYTFDVPTLGVIRIEAANIEHALMEVADRAGITLVSAVEIKPKKLRLVTLSDKSRVSLHAKP